MSAALPDKLFFKIGEVARIVGVRPHVLRYWESEFPALRPMKTRGAHRVYRRQDVELTVLIRRLLHDEGYTVAGAKRRLRELGKGRAPKEPDPGARRELDLRAELLTLRQELSRLLGQLDGIMGEAQVPETAPDGTAVPEPAVVQEHRRPWADGKKAP